MDEDPTMASILRAWLTNGYLSDEERERGQDLLAVVEGRARGDQKARVRAMIRETR
jgi:hypothetical protein